MSERCFDRSSVIFKFGRKKIVCINIWLKTLKYVSGAMGDKSEKEKINAHDIQHIVVKSIYTKLV